MKTKLTETKFKAGLKFVSRLFSRPVCVAAIILICSGASAQDLFVSGNALFKNCRPPCGVIYKFTWDGGQSTFIVGLNTPGDVAFDNAGNLFVADDGPSALLDDGAIYKITPAGLRTTFASGLSYPSYLAVDRASNVFVADYNHGIIYKYNPTGSRTTFASGLYHPVGMAFDRAGNLFVADNSIGNLYQGSIHQYKPDGSRVTFGVLDPSDRPADLAFDSMGNLYMADFGGNIYKYNIILPLRRYVRTTFGSVPSAAQSLAFDNAGNLFVVDAGNATSSGAGAANAIYKFTQQGVRSAFASGPSLDESFACLAFKPMLCCQ